MNRPLSTALVAGFACVTGLSMQRFIHRSDASRDSGIPYSRFRHVACQQRLPSQTVDQRPPKSCVVIGAGVIGLTTAYYLAKKGIQVTVIDSREGPALETSYANAGSLRREAVTPVLSSESVIPALKAIVRGDEYLSFQPSTVLSGSFLWWATNFAIGCMQNNLDDLRSATLSLMTFSHECLDEIFKSERFSRKDICYGDTGAIALYRTKEQFEPQLVSQQGSDVAVLNNDELIRHEPSLEYQKDEYFGGILYKRDRFGDCHRFCNALSQRLQRKYGVRFIFGETVQEFQVNEEDNQIDSVRTSEDRTVYADSFVVCCGTGSTALGSLAGDSICVYPMRGYTLTFAKGECPPKTMLMDPSHLFVTPMGDRVRFAGIGEFAPSTASQSELSVQSLENLARKLFPKAADWNSPRDVWMGQRPQTPDDLPIICKSRRADNLYYNTGHGSRGWVLAAGSGKLVTWMMCGRPVAEDPDIDEAPFNATRFTV